MSWLKVTKKALYLMQGGTDNYIDKVEFTPQSAPKEIKDFPYFWFSSKVTRPKTVIADKDDSPRSFSDLKFLKLFELPVNKQFYDELKNCRSLDAVLKKFYVLIGGFSDSFFKYDEIHYLLPPSISNSSDSEYYVDRNLSQSFPDLDFQEFEPDYDRKEPSFFDEIFLPLIWRNKVTILPKLEPFLPSDKNIRIKLTFKQQKLEVRESVDIQILDASLQPKAFTKPSNIFDFLEHTWKIPITRVGKEFPANVDISLIKDEKYTFTDIMDAIADSTMSDWDWSGRRAVIKQRS
jgi:hypothetical protein